MRSHENIVSYIQNFISLEESEKAELAKTFKKIKVKKNKL